MYIYICIIHNSIKDYHRTPTHDELMQQSRCTSNGNDSIPKYNSNTMKNHTATNEI